MTNDTTRPNRGPSDATDYSSSVAPETREGAEERDGQPSDARLWPGGRNATPHDPGIGSLDRDTTISGGTSPGLDVENAPPTNRISSDEARRR